MQPVYCLCLFIHFYLTGETKAKKDDKSEASQRIYRDACDRSGVAPQEAIALALPETEVNIRYRCLGDEDARAMCSALMVCVRVDSKTKFSA